MRTLINKIRDVGRSVTVLAREVERMNRKLDQINTRGANIPFHRRDADARSVHAVVTDPAECNFYHVQPMPDGTVTNGQWDLRSNVDEYLGQVDLSGKSVLEIGPASGYLSFYMESKGAIVTCIEPPMGEFWDLVPRADTDLPAVSAGFSEHIQRIRNSFWYFHGLNRSAVRMYEANPYSLPANFESFDVGLFGSVLLHCSSPVRMLESGGRHVQETMIVTERYVDDLADRPVCRLVPTPSNGTVDTWWEFSPAFFETFLAVMGFGRTRVLRHRQLAGQTSIDMFTVVASR